MYFSLHSQAKIWTCAPYIQNQCPDLQPNPIGCRCHVVQWWQNGVYYIPQGQHTWSLLRLRENQFSYPVQVPIGLLRSVSWVPFLKENLHMRKNMRCKATNLNLRWNLRSSHSLLIRIEPRQLLLRPCVGERLLLVEWEELWLEKNLFSFTPWACSPPCCHNHSFIKFSYETPSKPVLCQRHLFVMNTMVNTVFFSPLFLWSIISVCRQGTKHE